MPDNYRRSNGDVTSLNYRGTEYQSSEGGKYTHINSGLGTSTVSAQVYGTNYIKITIQSSGNPVTQYIVAKNGNPALYLATYITGEVSPGELRWLARLKKGPLPTGIFQPVADQAGGTAIEGSDVFLVNGQTRCKFFSSERYIDDQVDETVILLLHLISNIRLRFTIFPAPASTSLWSCLVPLTKHLLAALSFEISITREQPPVKNSTCI